MKRLKSVFQILLVLGLCFGISSIAFSHALWVNVTDYSPEIFSHPKYAPKPRAKTVAYFGWGHRYPVADFLDEKHLGDFFLVRPDGTREDLTAGNGGFRATEIKRYNEGARIVAATIKPGFHGEVEGKKDFYRIHYAQYAKALISVGEVPANAFSRAVGHRFEIIPLANPNQLQLGDWFAFKVLFDGKPAKRLEVSACSLFSCTGDSFEVRTDNEGQAKVRILHYYGPWIVKATLTQPPTEELKNKCQELSYTATLTFEVP